MKKNLLIAALFASVCGWAWADNAAPKNVAAVDVPTIVPTTPGDADGNGEVNILDVQLIFDLVVDPSSAPANYKEKNADVTGDGTVNILDASKIFDAIVAGTVDQL